MSGQPTLRRAWQQLQQQIFIHRHGFTDFLADLCDLDLLRLVGKVQKRKKVTKAISNPLNSVCLFEQSTECDETASSFGC